LEPKFLTEFGNFDSQTVSRNFAGSPQQVVRTSLFGYLVLCCKIARTNFLVGAGVAILPIFTLDEYAGTVLLAS
jgi:hypothetical protein